MSRRFEIHATIEPFYTRGAMFALEVLDGVTLSRVSSGLKIVAEGLRRQPIRNAGGLFVWLNEDRSLLQRVSIDPGALPYQRVELPVAQLRLPPLPRPLTTVRLPPAGAYPFPSGMTGVRGRLIEDVTDVPQRPVEGAVMLLQWLDDDGVTWQDAEPRGHTTTAGDFVLALALAPADVPRLDASGALTLRLVVSRNGGPPRRSTDLNVPPGRIADPATSSGLTVAWADLSP
jgi:hypothetical protein